MPFFQPGRTINNGDIASASYLTTAISVSGFVSATSVLLGNNNGVNGAISEYSAGNNMAFNGANFGTTSTPTFAGQVTLGVSAYTDANMALEGASGINNYYQIVLQNTNSGSTASADFVVANNLGTSATYYGDFGINSSGFTGSGSLNLPNATYVYSQNGDLAIGTNTTGNSLHLVVAGQTSDALSINPTTNLAQWGMPMAFKVISTAVSLSATSYTYGMVAVSDGTTAGSSIGSVWAGGGSTIRMVYSDGVNWRYM